MPVCRSWRRRDGWIERGGWKKGWGASNSWVEWGDSCTRGIRNFTVIAVFQDHALQMGCDAIWDAILSHVRTCSVASQVLCPSRAGPSASCKCTSAKKSEFAMHKPSSVHFFFVLNPLKTKQEAAARLKSRTARSRGAPGTCHISRRISNDSLLPVQVH